MSLIFDGELTSLYNCDEVSGPPQDSIGGHHMGSIDGGTFNGDSITLDGVNDRIRSSDENSNGLFITADQDYTLYMHLKTLSAIGASTERWMIPTPRNATKQGPAISPPSTGSPTFSFNNHLSSGAGTVSLTPGRDVNVDEEFLVIMSYDFSEKKIVGAVYSKDGLELSGEDSSSTTDPGFDPTDTYWFFFDDVGDYSHVELLEMGSIDGTFKTLAEVVDVAKSWKDPSESKSKDFLLGLT